jgi:hypothetical protein
MAAFHDRQQNGSPLDGIFAGKIWLIESSPPVRNKSTGAALFWQLFF